MTDRATPNPKARALAQQLLAYESRGENPSNAIMPAVVCVSNKLRSPLSTLAGAAGFSSLLARALALSKQDIPGSSSALNALHVKPDGYLELGEELEDDNAEAGVTLIARLLGLLFTFVGEALTLRLMHDVWPHLSYNYVESEKETKADAR